ncbi:substrate-binding periplasmic protein [Stutzerimonas nitrititolerans]|uniref:substrate-binding periplasmic protein n=1 Tax=Stutzerimonas nitrititolerans TaxID=2482751 RepID=UPI00289EB7E4|nr:transporter substrate-binding domain-containing protein [Stutzerimonas nitrititolerans]
MRRVHPLKFACLALLLTAPLTAFAVGKCDRVIATGAADNPPFLWRDPENPKRLIGASADLLKAITDSLGLKLEVLYTGGPSKALEEVRSGRVDLLLDANLDVEKLAVLDFVHPPAAPLQTVAWVRHEPGFLYAGRDDLAGLRGLVVKGDSFTDAGLQLRSAPDLAQATRSLLKQEADYVLHERYSAVARLGGQGLLDEVQRLEPPVTSREMHLAVAHDSACNDPWLRGQLAIKMTELRAADVPRQLLSENLLRWRDQQSKPANTP